MKQICRKLAAAVLCAALCLALAGCAKAGQAYPVSLGGVNITVGETTVGTLLDAGYTPLHAAPARPASARSGPRRQT